MICITVMKIVKSPRKGSPRKNLTNRKTNIARNSINFILSER